MTAHLLGRILTFRIFRFRRSIVLHNLALVFPRQEQESMAAFKRRIERLAEKNYQHYFLCLFEILERFHWTEEDVKRRVSIDGEDHLHKALHEKKGFFFLTAHIGNWELITLVGVFLKIPLAIVTRYLRSRFFDELWVRSRRRYGLELLEERGSGLHLIRAIREAKAVGFILDQHTGPPHGLLVSFLGQKAWCPKGLAILSDRLKAKVLPAYLFRKDNGDFRMFFGAPVDYSELEDPKFRDSRGNLNEEGQRRHIEISNRNMETFIREYPTQYLWLHRRFKQSFDYNQPLPWQI